MHGDATGCCHLAPVRTVGVEFKIHFSCLIRDLSWRDRQGPQGNARQGRIHTLAYLFNGSDLGLARKMSSYVFRRHIGFHGQHEARGRNQLAIRNETDTDPVLRSSRVMWPADCSSTALRYWRSTRMTGRKVAG